MSPVLVKHWLMFLLLARRGGGGGVSPLPSPYVPPTPGRNMTLAQLQSLAAHLGFPDPVLAAAIAYAESLGNPNAVNITTHPAPGNAPERSFGLWQINTLAHPQYDETQLLDPTYNGQAAFTISDGGRNWTPWSTYNSGAYKPYMGG